jgi:hypothetical protein
VLTAAICRHVRGVTFTEIRPFGPARFKEGAGIQPAYRSLNAMPSTAQE